MSKIKTGGLNQYGAGPFEQQQFGTAGVEGVNGFSLLGQGCSCPFLYPLSHCFRNRFVFLYS